MMNSLRDKLILVFLLGSSAISFASQATSQTDSDYNDNNHHHHSESGFDRILKAVPTPEYIVNGHQNSGFISHSDARKQRDYSSYPSPGYSYSSGEYTPNHNHQLGNSNNYNNNNYNGYQYIPPTNAADGYHYENPSEVAQNSFGSNYLDNNKNPTYFSEYPASNNYELSNSAKKTQGQLSNSRYHYEAPAQDYFRPTSTETGYNYDKPKYTSSGASNFKGNPYLPQASQSSSFHHQSYQIQQNQGHQIHTPSATVNGYQYESPKYSGYNYLKPQQSGGNKSSFKGQSYLPKPTTPTSSYEKVTSSQGYSYEKPSIPFKGESYLPQPSSGW